MLVHGGGKNTYAHKIAPNSASRVAKLSNSLNRYQQMSPLAYQSHAEHRPHPRETLHRNAAEELVQ